MTDTIYAVSRPQERTAGLDWFRYRVDHPEVVEQAQREAETIQAEDRARGEKVKPWTFQGYAGQASPRIRWGRRKGRVIWEASGQPCASTVTRMPSSGGRATRIDLQLTMRFWPPQPDYGTRCLPPEATTHRRRLPSGIPCGQSLGADGMWLGTVGDRTRHEYFRLYDKGVETRDFAAGNLWRLELEAKHDAARALCEHHLDQMTVPDWCASYVTSRWLSVGCLWPLGMDGERLPAARRAGKEPPTSDALMAWLALSVRPVIGRLLKTQSPEALILALGMERHVVPTPKNHDR
jgi:hypothetical protein